VSSPDELEAGVGLRTGRKQLHKLVNVLKIRDLEPEETLARELAVFKIATADGTTRAEVMQICEIFHAKIVDCEKVDHLEGLLRPFGLIEMARTGEIEISRGRSETEEFWTEAMAGCEVAGRDGALRARGRVSLATLPASHTRPSPGLIPVAASARVCHPFK
jgi:hypothetical protein